MLKMSRTLIVIFLLSFICLSIQKKYTVISFDDRHLVVENNKCIGNIINTCEGDVLKTEQFENDGCTGESSVEEEECKGTCKCSDDPPKGNRIMNYYDKECKNYVPAFYIPITEKCYAIDIEDSKSNSIEYDGNNYVVKRYDEDGCKGSSQILIEGKLNECVELDDMGFKIVSSDSIRLSSLFSLIIGLMFLLIIN